MLEVDDRWGERLELEAYLADFDARFWAASTDGVWKLERQQEFRQPESASWVAFSRGEWDEALRLLESNRPSLREEFRMISEAGGTVQRVRVVEEPIVPYLQWELHSLRLRAECGENIRVVGAQQVVAFEPDKPLPEIVALGTTVLYRLVYTDQGLLDGAVRFTDQHTVAQWRELIERLYVDGEDLASFFRRRVAGLSPPMASKTSRENGEDPAERPAGDTQSEISGSAGQAVQARDVHGGVHFHAAARALGPAPRQLPGDVRGFVNRLSELQRLSAFLGHTQDESAVVLIVGTAGAGKTALALHWSHQIREHFPDGQLYVNLRGYDPGLPVSPEQALERFLLALDIPASAIPADLESRAALYRSLLADRRILVVLDNAATVGQVRPLLPGASRCVVLVTSRSRLSGLVARDGAHRVTVGTLGPSEAIALLETVTADYRAHDNADQVAELARLCARLPLALRIAAERAASHPHMPLGDLIQDLRDESGLWDALTADDGDEADAVRSVFAWSYRALPADSAQLFRLLGIHPGPEFSTRAAAVLADTTIRRVRQQLDILTGAHLLLQTGPDRYQFHDLLRAYAIDQAQHEETAEGRQAILERLLTWYLYSAHSAATIIDSHLRPLSLPPAEDDLVPQLASREDAVAWYEAERDNLVAAIHAAASAGLHDLAWQLPVVLRHIYAFHTPEEWIATGLIGRDAARHVGARSGEADLLESLGIAHVQAGQIEQALYYHHEALSIRQETGDQFGQATVLNGIGLAHLRSRQLDQARTDFEQCLTLARQLGQRRWEGIALGNLADTLLDLGQPQQALDLAQQALTIHHETGNTISEFNSLTTISAIRREWNQLDEALAHLQHAQDLAQALNNPVREAYALLELGQTQLASRLYEEALLSYHRAAVLYRQLCDSGREAIAFDGTGEVYRELGRLNEAIEFHRRAVVGHRQRDDRWQLAFSLHHLAITLDLAGESDEAQRHWQEALSLLAAFSDPKAESLHSAIVARLPDSSESWRRSGC